MIKVASLPLEINLQRFSQSLSQQGVAHRISEESGRQVLWVATEEEAIWAREALSRFDPDADMGQGGAGSPSIARALLQFLWGNVYQNPLTVLLILACLIVAAISSLGYAPQRVGGLFYPLLDPDNFWRLLGQIDSPVVFLRTLSPMLLHFGELHLIFNMLWLWYFGRQLERIQPRITFLLLIVWMAFVSNTAQYMVSNFNNFGGMSGVVYGLVGYTWVIHQFMPRSYLLINNSMFGFFVVALIAMEILASSWIATAAHIGGLLCGLLAGVGMVIYYRVFLRRNVIGRPVGARRPHE